MPPAPAKPARPGLLIGIGKWTEDAVLFLYGILSFTGRVFACLARNLAHPRRLRVPSAVRHVEETGLRALPVIALLAFGVSMIIFYQGAVQLKKFGASVFTIDLTIIALLREMAVFTVAIMAAGRSGSAFAAEIGVMKLRGEVDALSAMGLDPIEILAAPRLIALCVALPLLTFFADIVGLAGGGVMSMLQLGMNPWQYVDHVAQAATPAMFLVGMIKAPVFAALIALICTYQGFRVTGSAASVGKLTTLAVVQSIFTVMMVDAAFSVVFSKAGL
jgi:phospholipid/cholesterol/gamma-HCH transport system permease protein